MINIHVQGMFTQGMSYSNTSARKKKKDINAACIVLMSYKYRVFWMESWHTKTHILLMYAVNISLSQMFTQWMMRTILSVKIQNQIIATRDK